MHYGRINLLWPTAIYDLSENNVTRLMPRVYSMSAGAIS